MAQDTKVRQTKPPEKKIGPFTSGIGVAIWLNDAELENGEHRQFRSVTINPRRDFDSKSGQWKAAASYQQADLPSLIFSLQKALEDCYETPIPGQEEAQAAEAEGGVGGRF